MTAKVTRILPCPQCKKSTHWQGNPDRPFCSERCRLIDLGKWADEEYKVESDVKEEWTNINDNQY